MLLSAAMLATALPLATLPVSAANNVAIGTDLLDGIKPEYSTTGYDVNVEDGNRFVHLYNRSNTDETGTACTSGFGYRVNGTLTANTVYYVSFDVRNAVAGIATTDGLSSVEHIKMFHTLRTSMNLVDIENFDGATVSQEKHSLAPSNKVLSDTGYTFKHSGNKLSISRSANGYYNLSTGNEWTYAEFIMIPEADSENPTIAYYRVPTRADVPIDIDNFKIWYYADGATEPTYIVNEDFEGEITLGTSESTRPGRFHTTTGYNGNNTSGKVAFPEEYDYTWVSAPKEAEVTYDLSSANIDGGVYTLSGDVRLDYFDDYFSDSANAKYDGEDNAAKLTLTVEGGGKKSEKVIDITSEWISFEGAPFYVTDGTTPNDVTVTISVDDDSTRTEKAINLRDVKLIKTGTARDIPASELGDDLLSGITPTSAQTVSTTDIKDGNRYLHLYDRKAKDINNAAVTSGLGYKYNGTLNAGTVYYVAFDVRMSSECITSAESSSNDVKMFHRASVNFKVEDIVDRGGTAFGSNDAHSPYALVPTDRLRTDTSYTFKTSENKLGSTRSSGGYWNLVPGTAWTMLELAVVPAADVTNPIFAIYRNPARADVPIDVDNFKLFYYKDGETTPTYLEKEDFEAGSTKELLALREDVNATTEDVRVGKFFTTNTYNGNTTSGTLTLAKEYDHYELAAPDLLEASATYSLGEGVTLEDGVYTLSGDVRMDYFDIFHTDEDNVSKVTVTAKVGGKDVTLGTDILTSEWTNLTGYKLYITPDTADLLTEITLTFTDESARDNKKFNFSNIRLTKTAGADSADIPDYSNLMNFGAASYSDEAYTVNVEDGNSYIHLYDRKITHPTNGSAISAGWVWRSNSKLSADTVYYISFDVRQSVGGITAAETASQDKANCYHQLRVGNLTLTDISQKGHTTAFDGVHPTPTNRLLDDTGYTFKHTDNELATSFAGAGFWNLIIPHEWTYAEFAFVPTETVSKDSVFAFYRNGGDYREVPMDIDNFRIWYYKSGSSTPTYLYNEDFEGGERGSYITDYTGTGTRDKFITSNATSNVPYAAGLDLAREYDYTKIAAADGNATVTYDFGEGIDLTSGVYVFDSDARLDYCDPNTPFVAGEDNKAAYTVKATIDGAEKVISDNIITPEWQDVETAVITVPAGETYTLTKITMIMADETGATEKALNIKNTQLRKMTSATDGSDEWSSDFEITVDDYIIDGKTDTYLHVYERGNYYDAVKYEEPDVTLKADTPYTLDVYMRGPVFEGGEDATAEINIYHTGFVSQFQISDEAIGDMHSGEYDTMRGTALLGSKWMRYSITFTPISDIDGLTLYFNSPGSADHSIAFDIAGLSLAESDKEGNIKGEELISAGEEITADGEAGWSSAAFTADSNVSLDICSDVMYRRVNNTGSDDTAIAYAETDTLAAGTYKLSGKVKLGGRDMDAVEYKLVKLGNTLFVKYVESDSNEATLTAYVGGDEIGNAELTNEWTDIEFEFTLDLETDAETLTVSLDGAYILDFADLTVDKLA